MVYKVLSLNQFLSVVNSDFQICRCFNFCTVRNRLNPLNVWFVCDNIAVRRSTSRTVFDPVAVDSRRR